MPQVPEIQSLSVPTGYHSQEVALFVGMLDDQLRLLTEDTRGLTVEQLAWQPAPGMNTIGMLLAHIAIVEVFWTSWTLYHLFEHFSGHYNQILLLEHAHKAGLHVHTHS